jgi:hypothetical protein
MRRRPWDALVLLALWTWTACGNGTGASSQVQLDNAPELEALTLGKGATPEQLLATKAKKYAQGLLPEGPTISASLQEGQRNDRLIVLRGGLCYRILGAGDDQVEDLDLFLYDPNGVQTHQDPGQDRFPVLGLQAEICPATSGAYRLQTLMYKGSGAYALGVYRTAL